MAMVPATWPHVLGGGEGTGFPRDPWCDAHRGASSWLGVGSAAGWPWHMAEGGWRRDPCPPTSSLQFGEHFEFDCKDCVCLEGGRGIICQPKECRQEPVTCTEDGTYPVTEVNPADTCCNITTCSKAAPRAALGAWGSPRHPGLFSPPR